MQALALALVLDLVAMVQQDESTIINIQCKKTKCFYPRQSIKGCSMSVMLIKRVLRVFSGLFLAAQPLTGLPDPEHHRITTSFSKAFFNPENSK